MIFKDVGRFFIIADYLNSGYVILVHSISLVDQIEAHQLKIARSVREVRAPGHEIEVQAYLQEGKIREVWKR